MLDLAPLSHALPPTRHQSVSGHALLSWQWPAPADCLSWAVLGGGLARLGGVTWIQVQDQELTPELSPQDLASSVLGAARLASHAALLTSARLESYAWSTRSSGTLTVAALATVGMGNARRVGSEASASHCGTINIAAWTNAALGTAALAECLSIMAEARTTSVLAASIRDPSSGELATGTGTDCVLMASHPQGPSLHYAGKHTELGSLLGRATLDVVARGLASWRELSGGSA